MTKTVTAKPKTGTALIVIGALLLAFAVFGLIQLPAALAEDSGSSGLFGVLLWTALGVALLVTGLNRRRKHLASRGE